MAPRGPGRPALDAAGVTIATTVISRAVRPVVVAYVAPERTGFVSGRNLVVNNLHGALHQPCSEEVPLLLALGIKAAFQLVFEHWLPVSLATCQL